MKPNETVSVNKDLIIHATSAEVEIALLENGRLTELHKQKSNPEFTVGDIFLGRIKKLAPGLNAAFVDIGHKKDAFLHYTDLAPHLQSLAKYTRGVISGGINTSDLSQFKLEPEIDKRGKIDQVLQKNQHLLVQILKEPISTKGPRLSCEITIPGRYLVLTPFNNVLAVSKKISTAEERQRLKTLVSSIKPSNMGLIVRTAAEGKKVADLHEELTGLLNKWEQIFHQLHKAKPPLKLMSELDKTSSILRDVLTDSFNKIVIDDELLYQNIRNFLRSIAPEQVKIVQRYRGKRPIFDAFGINRQIKSAFGKTATISNGAYLVIEHTEAMHVIDVNSGQKMAGASQEEAVLKVNLEAAQEIARQLRLRDLGGLIVVDFIDMRNREHKQQLVQAMRQFMKRDRAQHTVLPLSKFGLMQITRQRVRPEVQINTAELCPLCKGSGKVNPTVLVTDDIERDLKFIIASRPDVKITLEVHPFVEAFLRKGFPSKRMRWFIEHQKWVRLRSNEDLALVHYKFFDQNEEEIRL